MRTLALALTSIALLLGPASSRAEDRPSMSAADQQKLVDALTGEPQRPMKVRLQAAIILGRVGGQTALEALVQGLDDEEYAVRGASCMALGVIGDVRAIEPLVGALDDSEQFVRNEARKGLAMLGRPEALPYLRAAREHGSTRVRLALVDVAASMKGTESGLLLAELLGDTEDPVRAAAEQALKDMEPAAATAALIAGLDHPNYHVKAKCAQMLGARKELKALDRLADLAVSPVEAAEAQEAARAALRSMRDALDGGALLASARDGSKDRTARVRSLVLLSAKGGADAVQATLDILNTDVDESIRGSAAQALAEIGDPRALPPLREALGRGDNKRIARVLEASIARIERGRRQK